MNSFQRNPAWLLLVLAAILTCTQATEENGNPDILNVPDIFPQTATVLELLDHLQDSHGTTLSRILTLLLERVRASAVSDEVAKKIKEAIRFIDDPKTKEILDIIGGIVSNMSMDELLFAAFDQLEEIYSKTDRSEEIGLPEIQFPGDNKTYFVSQLDMLISEEDIETVWQGRVKRKAVLDEERLLWKGGIIPYHINKKDFSSAERHLIKEAMNHWAFYTCLEFRKRKSSDFNSLLISGKRKGCLSHVGQIGGTQNLLLGDGCKMLPIIVHELGHSLGLYHEHSRTDRNKYVEIRWENIVDVLYHRDFDQLMFKHRIEDEVPYDYTSVMHYGEYFWSKDRKNNLTTILAKDSSYQHVIGKAPRASFIDVKTISSLYNCSDGCIKKLCPDDGFLGKGCKCWCRGPDRETPVVPCKEEVACQPPLVDLDIYQVFHYETPDLITEFPSSIPSGTKLRVDNVDLRCGDAMTTITCSHGIWNLLLPPCNPDPCVIKPKWTEDYIINFPELNDITYTDILDVNVTHKSSINMTCISEPERKQVIECSFGNWTKVPLPCPELGGRCVVPDDHQIDFFLEATGLQLQKDDTVKHGHVVLASCDPVFSLFKDYDDYIETNLTCSNGRWIGVIPACPQPAADCPEIEHSQRTGGFPFGYNITCNSGYRLEIERDIFKCDNNGTWFPVAPNCIPEDCVIPDQSSYKATIKDHDGIILSEGNVVSSGRTVSFECPSGHTPSYLQLTCYAEKWSTEDGELPVCREVLCSGPPPVRNSSYSPHLRKYKFGDIVRINRCRGNYEQIGQQRIKCLESGSWSGSFSCRIFCDGGQIQEERFKNSILRARSKTYTTVKTRKGCKRRCVREKRFLCKSYVFGYDLDRRLWICQHYRINPNVNTALLQYKERHYLYARNCIE